MKKRICFIVSSPITADAFLKNHLLTLSHQYEVYLVANIESQIQVQSLQLNGSKSISIKRSISPIADIKALLSLYQYFKKNNFEVVHSVTPKAGLLTAIAAFLARVPNRIHIFTGQVWATKTGLFRKLLILMDKIIIGLDTMILVDGESQRQFLIKHKIIKGDKSFVIGKGSISGVNIERFHPSQEVRNNIRTSLGITDTRVVFIFLGRLNKDKGIYELFHAFNQLAIVNKSAYLLLVGIDEEELVSKIVNYPYIKLGDNFHFYGMTPTPEILLQAGDVFCLPTYREGFGTSVIEASCLGLPVICSDTYGVMDAMIDDVTGLRCKTGNVDSLFAQMKKLVENPELRTELGKNGRERVLKHFSGAVISDAWLRFYNDLTYKLPHKKIKET